MAADERLRRSSRATAFERHRRRVNHDMSWHRREADYIGARPIAPMAGADVMPARSLALISIARGDKSAKPERHDIENS